MSLLDTRKKLLCEELERLELLLHEQARSADHSTFDWPTRNKDATGVSRTDSGKFTMHTELEDLPHDDTIPHADSIWSGLAISGKATQKFPKTTTSDRPTRKKVATDISQMDTQKFSTHLKPEGVRHKILRAYKIRSGLAGTGKATRKFPKTSKRATRKKDASGVSGMDSGKFSTCMECDGLQYDDEIPHDDTVWSGLASSDKATRKFLKTSTSNRPARKKDVTHVSRTESGKVSTHMAYDGLQYDDKIPLADKFQSELARSDKYTQKFPNTATSMRPSRKKDATRVSRTDTEKFSTHMESDGLPRAHIIQSRPTGSRHSKAAQKSHSLDAATTDSIQDKSSATSVADDEEDSQPPSPFTCPKCDYKGYGVAMKQHCINAHDGIWQGEGKPLRDKLSAEQSFFARLRKQRFRSYQHIREEAMEAQCNPLQESSMNMSKSAEATGGLSGVNSVQDTSLLSASVTKDTDNVKGPLSEDKKLVCPNCSYWTLQLGFIRRHCIRHHSLIWQGKGLPLRAPHEGELPAKNAQVKGETLKCPNCDYVTSNPADIQLHCIRRHTLEWQGNGLPLRQPDNIPAETPAVADQTLACPECQYVTLNVASMRLHCIRQHSLEWQGQGLPVGRPGDKRPLGALLEDEPSVLEYTEQNQQMSSLQKDAGQQQFVNSLGRGGSFEASQISSEPSAVLHEMGKKSSKLEGPRPTASASIQMPSTATLITTGGTSAGSIIARDTAFLSSATLLPSSSTEQSVVQHSSAVVVSPNATATVRGTTVKVPAPPPPPMTVTSLFPGVSGVSDVTVSQVPSATATVRSTTVKVPAPPPPPVTVTSLFPGVSGVSDVTVSQVPNATATIRDTTVKVPAPPSPSMTVTSLYPGVGGVSNVTVSQVPNATATVRGTTVKVPFLSPPMTVTSLFPGVSGVSDVTVSQVPSATATVRGTTVKVPALPPPMTVTSLFPGVGGVSDVTVLQVPVPLLSRQFQPRPVTLGHSVVTVAPPCPPASIPPLLYPAPHVMATWPHQLPVAGGAPAPEKTWFACPNCDYKGDTVDAMKEHFISSHRAFGQSAGKPRQHMLDGQSEFETRLHKQQLNSQPSPHFRATPLHEVPASQPVQHSLVPPDAVMQPCRPGMMPPPVRAQLTSVPGSLPGQLPRTFSAAPATVCRNSTPEIFMNSNAVTSGLPVSMPAPPRLPSSVPAGAMFAPPLNLVQPVPRLMATMPPEVPVAQPVCHSLRPPCAVTQPCQPGMIPPPVREQLTSVPGSLPGQLPKTFLAAPATVCRISTPEIYVNSNAVTAGLPVSLPAPPRLPSSVPAGAMFAPPLNPVQPEPRLMATMPPEVPVAQPVCHSLRPPGAVMQPCQPGMMPLPVREQLTSVPGSLPEQLPRTFSAAPVTVCHNFGPEMPAPCSLVCHEPRPEMVVNSTPVQSQGQFLMGLPASYGHKPSLEMAINPTAIMPRGALPTRLRALSPMVCDKPRPEMVANSSFAQPQGQVPREVPAPIPVVVSTQRKSVVDPKNEVTLFLMHVNCILLVGSVDSKTLHCTVN